MVQSIQSGCLTLNCAVLFKEPHNRNKTQLNVSQRQVLDHLPKVCYPFKADCAVTALDEDMWHELYESLRRSADMGAAQAGQGRLTKNCARESVCCSHSEQRRRPDQITARLSSCSRTPLVRGYAAVLAGVFEALQGRHPIGGRPWR